MMPRRLRLFPLRSRRGSYSLQPARVAVALFLTSAHLLLEGVPDHTALRDGRGLALPGDGKGAASTGGVRRAAGCLMKA